MLQKFTMCQNLLYMIGYQERLDMDLNQDLSSTEERELPDFLGDVVKVAYHCRIMCT